MSQTQGAQLVRDFDNDKDLELINTWLKARSQRALNKSELPKVGMIFENVLAGFLYQTDSDMCFIENFVSNPKAKRKSVSSAIDFMTAHFVIKAKELGKPKVFVFTKKRSILNRAKELGFNVSASNYNFASMEVK